MTERSIEYRSNEGLNFSDIKPNLSAEQIEKRKMAARIQVRINGMLPHLDFMKTLQQYNRAPDSFTEYITTTEEIIEAAKNDPQKYTIEQLEEHLRKISAETDMYGYQALKTSERIANERKENEKTQP